MVQYATIFAKKFFVGMVCELMIMKDKKRIISIKILSDAKSYISIF